MTPRFFFISLGVLVSLIASVTAFLNLVFETLNKHYPDALNSMYTYGYSSYNYDAMRGYLATLIIVFPVFLVLSRLWSKLARGTLGHVDGVIKKWMLYLVIFLAGIVVVVDLVTLVRYFVSGEITTRFILKVLVVLVTALFVGKYYLLELSEKKVRPMLRTIAAIVASVLVLAAIIISFCVMGSPMSQRKLRLDERRVNDLQSLQGQIINYWQQKEVLPETLKDLANPLSGSMLPVDPEFEKGLTYEYVKTGKLTFDICATYSLPMPKGWQEYSYGRGGIMPMPAVMEDSATSVSYPGYGYGVNESWDHEAGRTCYSRTIDPQMYPPYPKPLY